MVTVGWAKYTNKRARNFEETQREGSAGAPLASRLLEISRARVCMSPTPQSPSPKLQTTRSLTTTNLQQNFQLEKWRFARVNGKQLTTRTTDLKVKSSTLITRLSKDITYSESISYQEISQIWHGISVVVLVTASGWLKSKRRKRMSYW